jgi:hypothetical protein
MPKYSIDFDKMIQSHTRWKLRLKEAIEHGKSDFAVVEARNSHLCQFGQWLDSAEAKKMSNYSEIVELHRNFHDEAANILYMALHNQKEIAMEKMKLEGGQFNHTAAELINEIAKIKQANEK